MVLFWGAAYCAAETIYVDVNGPNDPGTGRYEDPFRRIQDAIDLADTNDTVIVAEGHYYENLSIDSDNIILTSTGPNNPDIVANTIIDGNDTGSVITFADIEGSETLISGFTITGGYANYGGGIYCLNNSSPSISNCTIAGNWADDYGGGIYCFNNSNPTVTNCIIIENSADYGGGICCVASNPTIINCIISDNMATDPNNGGGIACTNSNPAITNCTIISNDSGVYCHMVGDGNCIPMITNCIFTSNTGPAIREYGNLADPNVTYCCFHNNPNGDWYDYDASLTLTGAAAINALPEARENIDVDPLLEPDGCHLQPYSPCINMGNPSVDYSDLTDIDGEPRILYGWVDIGADEVFPVAGDFEPDGDVDLADLAIISNHWLETGADIYGDINTDNTVDFLDFSILAKNWTQAP